MSLSNFFACARCYDLFLQAFVNPRVVSPIGFEFVPRRLQPNLWPPPVLSQLPIAGQTLVLYPASIGGPRIPAAFAAIAPGVVSHASPRRLEICPSAPRKWRRRWGCPTI